MLWTPRHVRERRLLVPATTGQAETGGHIDFAEPDPEYFIRTGRARTTSAALFDIFWLAPILPPATAKTSIPIRTSAGALLQRTPPAPTWNPSRSLLGRFHSSLPGNLEASQGHWLDPRPACQVLK